MGITGQNMPQTSNSLLSLGRKKHEVLAFLHLAEKSTRFWPFCTWQKKARFWPFCTWQKKAPGFGLSALGRKKKARGFGLSALGRKKARGFGLSALGRKKHEVLAFLHLAEKSKVLAFLHLAEKKHEVLVALGRRKARGFGLHEVEHEGLARGFGRFCMKLSYEDRARSKAQS